MKYPRTIKTYCPRCGKHTLFTVSQYKKGQDRRLAEGNRRYARKQEGYGGQRAPRQRKTAKTTKKQSVILSCNTCGYKTLRLGIRLRKLELEA
ncbi:MAG: 50S ribosomal protein L44e [Candidatus Ranarchaeia archaeon]|jgi:large subunit ribosomal protein L44e